MSVLLKDEVCGAALGDQRLTKRLGKVIEQLGAKPNMSVPDDRLTLVRKHSGSACNESTTCSPHGRHSVPTDHFFGPTVVWYDEVCTPPHLRMSIVVDLAHPVGRLMGPLQNLAVGD
jgi:hypothetical protein